MPTYHAYGLTVDSELPLPELESTRADADVRVRLGSVPEPPTGPTEDGKLYRTGDGHYATVEGVGSLFATEGRRLVVDPDPDADADLIRQFVLGQGFRTLLYQRDHVVLHASAAVVDGHAVAFVGDSGQGKSTTLAACYGEGHSVLADDVVAVDPDTCEVRPGFSQVKLDAKAAESLGANLTASDPDEDRRTADPREDQTTASPDEDLPTTEPGKRQRQYYATPQEFGDELLRLEGIYLLRDGEEIRVEPLPPTERPYELMRASASAYHSADDEGVEPHLDACVRLSESVPMKRLERPRRFDALPELVRAVEADVAETTERATTPEPGPLADE